jgi:hypothetical protein
MSEIDLGFDQLDRALDIRERAAKMNRMQKAFSVPDFEESQKKYADRFSAIIPDSRQANLFDLASNLGAQLLSQPTGPGSFARGLGMGFTAFNQQLEKTDQEKRERDRTIGIEALKLATTDENAAKERISKYIIEEMKQANRSVKYLTFEMDELDAEGKPTGKRIQVPVPDYDRKTQEAYRNNRTKDNPLGVDRNVTVTGQAESQVTVEAPKTASYFAKAEGAAASDMINAWVKEGNNAKSQLNSIDQALIVSEKLTDENFGTIASNTLPFRKLLTELGVIDDSETIGDQELMLSLGTRFAMALVGQTKGAVSDREMELFIRASANLGQSLEGFKKQLGYLRKIADLQARFKTDFVRDAKEGKIYTSEMSDEEVASALRAYQENWQQQNPFLTEDDRAILNQAALQSTKEASAWRKGYLDRISKQQATAPTDMTGRGY